MTLDSTQKVDLKDWVGERSVEYVSNNVDSKSLPFQSWRPFKEAFAPEIVQQAILNTPGKVKNLCDPFGGSGTSALTAQFLGVHPTTCEVNPFLADLIEAKLTEYDPEILAICSGKLDSFLDKPMRGPHLKMNVCPKTFVEPGVNGRFIFSKAVASAIVKILNFIDSLEDVNIRRLFRVLLAPVAVEISNVYISGKGRRYKRNWENNIATPDELISSYKEKIDEAVKDILKYPKRAHRKYQLHRGDSRKIILPEDSQDVVVFSPPYPNSFDYTDVYNVELWILGYLNNWDDNRELRRATLRSHVQIKRVYESEVIASPTLKAVYDNLTNDRDKLWSNDIPEMILSYFVDMKTVMAKMSAALRDEGHLYCVVGDSQYAGHYIPVANILIEIAGSCYLKHLQTEEIRSMRTAPQQGGRMELPESLQIFSFV